MTTTVVAGAEVSGREEEELAFHTLLGPLTLEPGARRSRAPRGSPIMRQSNLSAI
jgi:hypothetical protein